MDENNLDENLRVYLIPLAPDDEFSPSDNELESALKTYDEQNGIGMLIADSSTNSVAVPSTSAAVTPPISDISSTSRSKTKKLKKAPVKKKYENQCRYKKNYYKEGDCTKHCTTERDESTLTKEKK